MNEKKMTRQEKREKQIKAIKELMDTNGGVAKTSQLYTIGMDYRKIQNFVDCGIMERVKNGYYAMNYRKKREEDLLAALFSDCVLCMESALYIYHYIKTKPLKWTLAVDKNTSKSRFQLDYPLVQPYYTEPEVLRLGAEKIVVGSSEMSIYSKERLICDILKYEDRMKHEDLQHALRAYINDKNKDVAKLLSYAKERKVLSKVHNQIGVWLIPNIKDVRLFSDNIQKNHRKCFPNEYLIVEKFLDILDKLELLNDLSGYMDIYEILRKESVSGRTVCELLSKGCKIYGISMDEQRFELFVSYRTNNYMKKKWKAYLRHEKKTNPAWDEVIHIMEAFFSNIWMSMCQNVIYLGDWMPELGRFID